MLNMLTSYGRVDDKSALPPMNKFACKLHWYMVYFSIRLCLKTTKLFYVPEVKACPYFMCDCHALGIW